MRKTISPTRLLNLCLLPVVLMTGCGWMKDKLYTDYAPAPLDSAVGKTGDAAQAPYQRIVENVKKWENSPVTEICLTSKSPEANDCRTTRDYVAAVLISASNELCTQHLKRTYGNEASYNLVFGTLTNLFSGGAAVIGGEATKAALGALAVFSNAERSLINESVYKTMLVQAITQKISDSRRQQLAAIDQRLLDPNYSAPRMIRDVLEYHDSCSFMNGLQLALKEGIQDGGPARLAALRASVNMAKTELDLRLNEMRTDVNDADKKLLFCSATSTDPQNKCTPDAVCNSACLRYNALSQQLIKIETQAPPVASPPVAPAP